MARTALREGADKERLRAPRDEALQQLARRAVCRRFHGHYSGFFRAMCRDLAKVDQPTAKRVLYAYRVAVTGIHLLRTGELEADLSILAEPYGVPQALPLIEQKRATAEKVLLDEADAQRFGKASNHLEKALDDALAASPLPEEPPNRSDCETWLVEVRRRGLEKSGLT